MSKDNQPNLAEMATDIRWIRGWAEGQDKKVEKIGDRLDDHGERISALSARQKMILAIGSPVLVALLVAVVKMAVVR
jgi:hypothetical protein